MGLSEANLSKMELCRRIQKQLPKFVFLEAPVGEDPDKRDYIVSNAKIEATGFKTEFSLDRGIGLGYVTRADAAPGTCITVSIRNREIPATVVPLPFIAKK